MGAVTQWLELRVHGVHGTTPASLLGIKEVDQVAGDGLTGFYRAPAGTPLPYRALDDTVAVEAYSWGALTSGVAGFLGWVKRVLWLLLIPFALVNLAYWARLTVTDKGRRGCFTAAAVRLSALVLTVFLVCSVSFVCVDLFSWQCFRGGVAACPSLPGWLQSLSSLRPGIRLAIGMLLPLAVVLILWMLARTTLARYEATRDPTATDGTAASGSDDAPPVLSQGGLWSGTGRTTELRNLHVAAGFATVTTLVAGHAWREAALTSSAGWRSSFLAIGLLGVFVLLLCVVACVKVDNDYRRPSEPAGWGWLIPSSGLLSLVTLALLVLQPRSAYDEYIDFRFHNQMFVVLFVALTVLHLSVFSADRIEKSWWWWVPPVVAFVAVVGGYVVTLTNHRSQRLDLRSAPVQAAIAVLVVLGVFATWWHFFGPPHRDHADKAWNGAGASVMMAAAAWIALLFTTAGVTGAANYLNGSQSVARLTTSVEPYGASAPTTDQLHQLTLQGPVDVRALHLAGDRHGFVVSATSAWLTPRSGSDTEERFYVVPGTYGASTLQLPAGTRLSHTGHGSSILPATRYRHADVLVLELSAKEHSALVLPPVLIWAPIAQLVWLLVAGLLLVGCWLTFRHHVAKRVASSTDPLFESRDFRPSGGRWTVPMADREPVKSARASAALSHRAESLLSWIGVITAPIALVLVGLSSTKDYVALSRGSTTVSRALGYAANMSLLVVLGFSAALLLLGSKVRADEGWRKNVGIIWDLTTFWPRAAHPLAPPCYAERVIPELLTRVAWARPRANVVIAAHSQGSLISVAMLMRLEDLSGIHLLTFGSQVRGLYGRVFPRVFGPEAIPYQPTTGPIRLSDPFPDLPRDGEGPSFVTPTGQHLSPLVEEGRWVNLFRRADPLGYRVFSDTVGDEHDRVVIEVPSATYGDAGPAVLGHSSYQHSPEYRSLISQWTGATWVGPPTPPEVVGPLPGH